MKTTALRKIGNSQGIILDKTVLDLVGVNDKAIFQLKIDGETISLTPLSKEDQKSLIQKSSKKISSDHAKTLKKLSL